MPSRILLAFVVALATTACTGPSTHVENPGGHRVFVDGQQCPVAELPFRFYGTSRWDALPVEPKGKEWTLSPATGRIELPAPASPWLFPFDLPLELMLRAVHGRQDATATVVLPPAGDLAIAPGEVPDGSDELVARAVAARIWR